MLENQKKYIEYIEFLNEKLENFMDIEKLNLLKEKIRNQELLIPIIGGFSAGKSTLINIFLEENILKVDITPETALATEMRYSSENYIEAVSENNVERFKIEDIDFIKENAKNYKFMRVYFNNKNLKSIEPLVLVDMPGFNSPVDLHNEAILNYLDKGVHFIVLISVEEGTLSKSILRQLCDISELNKDFSFFLSKANLKADSEIEEIKEKIEELIDYELDIQKNIIPITNKSSQELQKVLNSINPENIIKELFLEELKNNYLDIEGFINTKIQALTTSNDENEKIIKELQHSISSLENKKQVMIREAKEKYSIKNVDYILSSVEKVIVNNIDNLANLALKNPNYFEKEIIEIIRSTLIMEIKTKMSEISEDITQDFALDLKSNINVEIQDDFFSMISKNILTLPGMNKVITTMLGGVLKFLPVVLNPVIGVIVAVLPHILGNYLERQKEQKQKEEIKKQILVNVIPSIKMELRKNVISIFEQQVNNLISEIASEFEEKLQVKKIAIEEVEKEKHTQILNIEIELEKYKNLQKEIKEVSYEKLYKD